MRLVHTSDLHLFATRPAADDLAMVRALAATVAAVGADVMAVAGDLFDHNRVPEAEAADLLVVLAEPGVPVVVLPGNHDPLTAGSVYRRVDRPPNLFVLGLDGPELVLAGGLSIGGRAHLDYGDFPPLNLPAAGETLPGLSVAGDMAPVVQAAGDEPRPPAGADDGPRVVLAHGHYDLAGEAGAQHRPGWLITGQDLDRLSAAYVGLGHWDRAYEVRPVGPPTYYSGSPWLVGSVNVVDVSPDGSAAVRRVELGDPARLR